jgi:hypothetical protein
MDENEGYVYESRNPDSVVGMIILEQKNQLTLL